MTQPVRIPADVDREDTVLANLTARQVLILAVTGTVLYGLWSLTRHTVPLVAFLVVALPVAAAAVLLALGRRDGLSLDRLALAAVRQHLAPRYRITAPEGVPQPPAWLQARVVGREPGQLHTPSAPAPQLPAQEVTETGLVDLGTDGLAVLAVCGTVNFALRTPPEQEALISAFGSYLHSLTAPVQILVRAERLDLSGQVAQLRTHAEQLPHPALETAAHEHADYLEQLAHEANLLRRQVLLVLREPLRSVSPEDNPSPFTVLTRRTTKPRDMRSRRSLQRSTEALLLRRLAEASELLGPIGIAVSPLDSARATTVLATACNPDSLVPPSQAIAAARDVITSPRPHRWEEVDPP
ncbi:PrgI family protein [Streptomyces sp. NPDC001401]|uniref:PrgI family protein n=1 Tax=Streptomyces sp. NPDC001401 TaxID=3364570 RepID=UPI0036746137